MRGAANGPAPERHVVSHLPSRTGLTPKLLARLIRFHRALALRRSRAGIGWAELAAECGYFDQAHLTAEFAEFAGVTPARLFGLAETARPDCRTGRSEAPAIPFLPVEVRYIIPIGPISN
jgi:AraC-like DNA-binding protein